jgi:hypothetical protein
MKAIRYGIIGCGHRMRSLSLRLSQYPEIELAGAYRCSVESCYANTSQGAATNDYWFSFDVGGRENLFYDMHIDCSGTGSPTAGLVLESNESSNIDSNNNMRGKRQGGGRAGGG